MIRRIRIIRGLFPLELLRKFEVTLRLTLASHFENLPKLLESTILNAASRDPGTQRPVVTQRRIHFTDEGKKVEPPNQYNIASTIVLEHAAGLRRAHRCRLLAAQSECYRSKRFSKARRRVARLRSRRGRLSLFTSHADQP